MKYKKPKICMVVPVFPRTSETFIVSKFLRLRKKGFNVAAFSHSKSTDWHYFPYLKKSKNLKRCIYCQWPVHPRWLVPLAWPVTFLQALMQNFKGTVFYFKQGCKNLDIFNLLKNFYLDQPLIRFGPDIVHFEFGALAKEKMYLNDLLGCKIVVSFRGYDLNFVGITEKSFYDEIFNNADMIHFLGTDLVKRAERRGYDGSTPYRLIPPGIDINLFKRDDNKASRNDEKFRILSVGRLHWKKGYEYALQAAAILRKNEVRFRYRIIGDGEGAEALYLCCHQLGLETEVEFLGAMPHEKVMVNLRWADVFLHAAISEGFCNAVLEAQTMGLPVVTSDADGLSENVQDGVTGFVVPRRDPAALAEKIFMLCRDTALRVRLGENGRARAAREFSIERQIERFAEIYDTVLNL